MSTPSGPAAPAASSAPSVDGADRIRGRLMAQSLMLLLNKVRGSREVLPHLAALERGLAERGARAIGMIPAHWLTKICTQLSSLPIPEQDPPLHDLLNRLLEALQVHEAPEPHGTDRFDMERTVVIREISHSEFEAAAAEQATTLAGTV